MRQFASHAQARRSLHLWMATVETHIARISPAHAGRIDWDTATFLFNQEVNPAEAASRLVASAPVDRR